MKYVLKEGKSIDDMPVFSKLLKIIVNSIRNDGEVELDIVPKAAKEFLEEKVLEKPKKIKGDK